ncbi:MAG: hypothetical protein J6Y92_05325 [Lentisphaeria bacterium]|nr:hypothetical protein [Lentisphaeria bacterium]
MSAQPDKDDLFRQDGNDSVPFDPADYARREHEPSPEDETPDGTRKNPYLFPAGFC